MLPSKLPDLTSPARLALLSVLVAVVMTVALYYQDAAWLPGAFGDTDDATRIVMVRELLAGRGWWEQHWMRLQPPVGVYMHWSRLLDGGLALLTLFFQLFLSTDRAELATRIIWPMLWVIPAAWSVLVITRRLATSAGHEDRAQPAVIGAMILMLINVGLYAQFHPGRVDHHNAQIALCLLALAGAVQPSHKRAWAVLAGVAGGLGLAVGLEALFFHVLLAGLIAFRFAINPAARRFVQAYAAALGVSCLTAYAIQTPPDRWAAMACDAEAANLATAVAIGCGLLVIGMRAAHHRDSRFRVLALAMAGGGAMMAYLGLDPNCAHGPFADVDVRIKPIWLDHVTEVADLPTLMKRTPDLAYANLATAILGGGAALALLLAGRRMADTAWWATSTSLVLGVVVGWLAVRMAAYPAWFAIPLLAAAAALLARRYEAEIGSFAAVGAALVLAPIGWGGMAAELHNNLPNVQTTLAAASPFNGAHSRPSKPVHTATKAKAKDPPDYCFNGFAYKALGREPRGLTLSEIDLGPFVLAYTPSSSLSGPYHRLSWGIMAARGVLSADAEHAYPMIRKLGVTHILECPMHQNHADRSGLARDTLQKRLDRGDTPNWLQPITAPRSPVMIYRVLSMAKTQ